MVLSRERGDCARVIITGGVCPGWVDVEDLGALLAAGAPLAKHLPQRLRPHAELVRLHHVVAGLVRRHDGQRARVHEVLHHHAGKIVEFSEKSPQRRLCCFGVNFSSVTGVEMTNRRLWK